MRIGIRADGGSEIGYGHLVRTNALARRFLDAGDKITYYTKTPKAVREVCDQRCEIGRIEPIQDESVVAKRIGQEAPTILVIDSYTVPPSSQVEYRRAVPVMVNVDDLAEKPVSCDVLLNGNIYAPKLTYDWLGKEPDTLLGTEYLLLRRDFQELAERTREESTDPLSLIVTLGGSDDQNLTPTILRGLRDVDAKIETIVGPGFDNKSDIEDLASSLGPKCNLHHHPANLPTLMFDADIAICATGSTTYELLVADTAVLGVACVPNQKKIATSLEEKGSIEQLPESITPEIISERVQSLLDDEHRRAELRTNGRRYVDGRGVKRVFEYLTTHPNI